MGRDTRRRRRVIAVLTAGAVAFAIVAGTALGAGGQLDTSFSTDGKRTVAFSGGDQANAVAFGPGGRIVVAGSTGNPGWGIAVLKPGGSLDHSFSNDGKRTLAFDQEPGGVAVQRDGKIVIAGADNLHFAVARLNSNGSLDTSFSGDGKRTLGFGGGSSDAEAEEVAVQADGRIVAAGYVDQPATGSDFAIARFKSNGGLDQAFSGDGKQTVSFGNGTTTDEGDGLAIQENGKIVVGGESEGGFAVARLNSNGDPDSSFSGDGRRTTGFGPGSSSEGNATSIHGGKIIVAGFDSTTQNDFAVARFKDNGGLDQTFSGDGKQTVDFGTGGADEAEGLAVDAAGRVVVAGNTDQGSGLDFAVARLTAGGNLDTGFSGDGRRVLSFNNGTNEDVALAAAIQPNGRIVIAGHSTDTTGDHFAIARMLAG